MAEPLSSFMRRVERARGEYCSFPTVIKSYDPHDSGIVLEVEARDRLRGQRQRAWSEVGRARAGDAACHGPSLLHGSSSTSCSSACPQGPGVCLPPRALSQCRAPSRPRGVGDTVCQSLAWLPSSGSSLGMSQGN